MWKYLFLIIASFICTTCYAKNDTTLIANWKSCPVPSAIEQLVADKPRPTEWTVFLKNDTTRVIDIKNYNAPKLPFNISLDKKEMFVSDGYISFLKVDDGYLVGINNGEFGGGLFWFSADGKKNYKISYDIVIQFIERSGKIYTIQGLAHMGFSYGGIANVEKENSSWVVKQYLKLPAAPEQIALDDQQEFIIVTSKGLLKVDKTNDIHTLIDTAIWYHRANANSMVIENNQVYVGLFGGVYKYDLNTGKQYWLLNK